MDETLVVLLSEHGRTPKLASVQGGGRDHWSRCYSVVMAGGGVKRGYVLGKSDKIASDPLERRVSPKDILATIYHLLGIDPATTLTDQQGRPMALHPRPRSSPKFWRETIDSAHDDRLRVVHSRPRTGPVRLMEPFIDAHSHIWTPDVAHYPLAAGFKVADMQPASFTAEELLALCRPAGVGRVNLIQMSYYEFDNRYMLDMIKLYPDRFVGTAIVDPLADDPGRCDARARPAGCACLPHPAPLRQAAACPLARARRVRRDVRHRRTDRPGPLVPDRSRRVPRSRPDVRAAFPRPTSSSTIWDASEPVPTERSTAADVEALCNLAKHPKIYVKVGAFYALGKKKPPYTDLAPLIRDVVKAFGARRCMWESDCPFQVVKDRYTDSLALIRDHLDFLTNDDRDWLLFRTAEEILFKR